MIMKKKKYIAPECEVIESDSIELLTVSDPDRGIGYGGVDTGGTKEPSARTLEYFCEDEE